MTTKTTVYDVVEALEGMDVPLLVIGGIPTIIYGVERAMPGQPRFCS